MVAAEVPQAAASTVVADLAVPVAPVVPVPMVAAAPAEVMVAATPAQGAPVTSLSSMPKVFAFALPKEELVQVALSSGLQWVNSDPERVAQVQAAIASEPQPVHVPRERPAPVELNEGPLILVETKRDLRNMTLPFEESTQA
jgi:ribonuclease E